MIRCSRALRFITDSEKALKMALKAISLTLNNSYALFTRRPQY